MSQYLLSRTQVVLIQAYMKQFQDLLSCRELKELAQHPVGSAGMEKLNESQLELRKSIAKKIYLNASNQYPFYEFYTDKNTASLAIRVSANQTHIAGQKLQDKCTENVELIPIHQWNTKQRESIYNSEFPSLFFDPCGWIALANSKLLLQ